MIHSEPILPLGDPGVSGYSVRRRGTGLLFQLACVVIVVCGLRLGRDILIPISLAVLLSFLLAPLATMLERLYFGRVPAIAAVVLVLFVVAGLFGWLVIQQLNQLAADLPRYADLAQSKYEMLRSGLDESRQKIESIFARLQDPGDDGATHENGSEAARSTSLPPKTSPYFLSSENEPVFVRVIEEPYTVAWQRFKAIAPILEPVSVCSIVVVLLIFCLLQRENLRDRCIRLIGSGNVIVPTQALNEAGRRVSQYLITQSTINGSYGAAAALCFYFLGMPSWALWGFLCAAFRFLPYIGIVIGAGAPILILILTSEGWGRPLLGVGLLVFLELVTYLVCEPWFFRMSTGVSPFAIFVSAFFWTILWGPVGLLLATPVTVCLVVLGKYIPHLRSMTLLLSDQEPLAPHEQYYRRLVDGQLEEADAIIASRLKGGTLRDVYDEIVCPALRAAKVDLQSGQLPEAQFRSIHRSILDLVESLGEGSEGGGLGSLEESPVAAVASRASYKVACLPARGVLDELAAKMLVQVFQAAGYQAECFSSDLLVAEVADRLRDRELDVGLIATVEEASLHQARRLAKRLAIRSIKTPIGVVAWGFKPDAGNVDTEHSVADTAFVTFSVRESLEAVERLLSGSSTVPRPAVELLAVKAIP